MKILIGLPIYDRAWILPDWLTCIENQTVPLTDIGFIFELAPNDKETHNLLYEWHNKHPEIWFFDARVRIENIEHKSHEEGQRDWQLPDYDRMTAMRNALLDQATMVNPNYYLSLDSDILLKDANTIELLVQYAMKCDAVAPTTHMWPVGKEFPNVMTWTTLDGKASRVHALYPSRGVFQVDVIMAVVMMSRQVYKNVRYRPHFQGEDLGWSLDAKEKGFKLFSAAEIYTPHIMHKWMLEQYHTVGDLRGNSGIYPLSR